MSGYGDMLRTERRSELAVRVLPSEMFNEYGEVFAVTKKEGPNSYPAGDYAYVPDATMPSTWKLRLTSAPGGNPDPAIVGAAVAALGKGFMGNKVQIPAADLEAVKKKVHAAWLKANPDKDPKKDMPSVIASVPTLELEVKESMTACGHDDEPDVSIDVVMDGISATPSPEVMMAYRTLTEAINSTYSEYDCDINVYIHAYKANPAPDMLSSKLVCNLDGVSQTPSDIIKMAYDSLTAAVKTSYGPKNEIKVKISAESSDMDDDNMPDMPMKMPMMDKIIVAKPMSEIRRPEYNLDEEFGSLPPALMAQIVKKLKASLGKETDPKKKAEIQAKIDKYSMSIIDQEELGTLPPALMAQVVKKLKASLAKETDPDKKAAIQAKIDKYSA